MPKSKIPLAAIFIVKNALISILFTMLALYLTGIFDTLQNLLVNLRCQS